MTAIELIDLVTWSDFCVLFSWCIRKFNLEISFSLHYYHNGGMETTTMKRKLNRLTDGCDSEFLCGGNLWYSFLQVIMENVNCNQIVLQFPQLMFIEIDSLPFHDTFFNTEIAKNFFWSRAITFLYENEEFDGFRFKRNMSRFMIIMLVCVCV